MTLIDLHSHRHEAADALLSLSPREAIAATRPCSVGIHPWDSAHVTHDEVALLDRAARQPHVLAIGETGLDALRGASLPEQMALLEHHIALAERVDKPLIIHLVRALEPLLKVWRATRPHTVPAAIHGFRGKPAMARQLLDAGFWLSFGPRFNALSLAVTPVGRRLFETDDTGVPIVDVLAATGTTAATAAANVRAFLGNRG